MISHAYRRGKTCASILTAKQEAARGKRVLYITNHLEHAKRRLEQEGVDYKEVDERTLLIICPQASQEI